jgi:hypothetical protein
MSTKKNTQKGKGKLANLEPKSNPGGGVGASAHGGGGGAGKVQMQDFHFV